MLGVQLLKPIAEIFADLDDMLEHVVLLEGLEKLQCDRACQGAAAEGCPVQTGVECLRNRFGGKNRSQRQPGRERLGDGGDVGQNAIVLIGEHLPRAAKTALNLIENQHRAGFLRQRPRGLQELATGGDGCRLLPARFQCKRAYLRS